MASSGGRKVARIEMVAAPRPPDRLAAASGRGAEVAPGGLQIGLRPIENVFTMSVVDGMAKSRTSKVDGFAKAMHCAS